MAKCYNESMSIILGNLTLFFLLLLPLTWFELKEHGGRRRGFRGADDMRMLVSGAGNPFLLL